MAIVFIAGHGRMQVGKQDKVVPPRTTVRWAVEERYGSSPHVSRNMIVGRNKLFSTTATKGQAYYEHWLMPDGGDMMTLKARDLQRALNGSKGYPQLQGQAADYWLLQPRGVNAVPLSAILAFLELKIPSEPIEVRWTCCRSPIGEKSHMKMTIHAPYAMYKKSPVSSPNVIAHPDTSHEFKAGLSAEDFTIKHTCADGTVTLVQGSDSSALVSVDTWLGIKGVAKAGSFLLDSALPK